MQVGFLTLSGYLVLWLWGSHVSCQLTYKWNSTHFCGPSESLSHQIHNLFRGKYAQHIKTQQVFLIVSNDTNFEAWRGHQDLEEWSYKTVTLQ